MSGPGELYRRTKLERGIASALTVDDLIVVRLQCGNQDCAVREIKVRCKDYDGTLLPLRPGKPTCPFCGTSDVSVHNVRTFREDDAASDVAARERVNLQMWLRDNQPAESNRPVCFSAERAMDDRLPPTPDGWW